MVNKREKNNVKPTGRKKKRNRKLKLLIPYRNSERYKRTFVFHCVSQVQVGCPIYIIGLETNKHKE
jgi:hypothetical protein